MYTWLLFCMFQCEIDVVLSHVDLIWPKHTLSIKNETRCWSCWSCSRESWVPKFLFPPSLSFMPSQSSTPSSSSPFTNPPTCTPERWRVVHLMMLCLPPWPFVINCDNVDVHAGMTTTTISLKGAYYTEDKHRYHFYLILCVLSNFKRCSKMFKLEHSYKSHAK